MEGTRNEAAMKRVEAGARKPELVANALNYTYKAKVTGCVIGIFATLATCGLFAAFMTIDPGQVKDQLCTALIGTGSVVLASIIIGGGAHTVNRLVYRKYVKNGMIL